MNIHCSRPKPASRRQGPTEGVEMFNALMEQKTSHFQLQILKNRIKKLEHEEMRAKMKIERANQRVRELEMQKAIKQQEREENNIRANQRVQDIMNQLRTNREEKERNKYIIDSCKCAHLISQNL